jgi:hypothetical protein
MPTVRTMMRPPMSLMAQVEPAVFDAVVTASAIAPTYATDTDPESAREMLAARMTRATEEAAEPMEGVADPESPGERRMRPTRAPERGVDWGKVATEGGRVVRSGTFNTILRAVFGILTGGRRR